MQIWKMQVAAISRWRLCRRPGGASNSK